MTVYFKHSNLEIKIEYADIPFSSIFFIEKGRILSSCPSRFRFRTSPYCLMVVLLPSWGKNKCRALKHQSSASLAFVRGIHRWPVNSPHKGPLTRKFFPFDDVIMIRPTNMSYFSTLAVLIMVERAPGWANQIVWSGAFSSDWHPMNLSITLISGSRAWKLHNL